jgi:glutamate dehydrogenase/leucine dehydrogenase
MREATERVFVTAERLGVDYRVAALSAAVGRVADAARQRAIYP